MADVLWGLLSVNLFGQAPHRIARIGRAAAFCGSVGARTLLRIQWKERAGI